MIAILPRTSRVTAVSGLMADIVNVCCCDLLSWVVQGEMEWVSRKIGWIDEGIGKDQEAIRQLMDESNCLLTWYECLHWQDTGIR
jgi:hypothetical protein